jgi:AcrR family transcriptional regulator
MAILERRRRDDPRRGQTEAAFLDAAAALLSEGLAFADLSVSVVAARAGRTRTAFYAHFEDRRELLMRLVEPMRAEAQAVIAPFVEGDNDDDVRAAIAGLLATLRRHEAVARAVVEAAGYDTEVDRLWTSLVGEFATANQGRLVRAGVPEAQAAATASVLTWMTERSCTQQLRQDPPALDDEAVINALSDAWRRALQHGA